MKLLLNLREEGCFGNKSEVSIKEFAEWAAKGKFFLSAQDNHLVSKTIEEEMGEILRSEFPRKINKRGKTSKE